jgi:hypothetical protein
MRPLIPRLKTGENENLNVQEALTISDIRKAQESGKCVPSFPAQRSYVFSPYATALSAAGEQNSCL